MKISPALPCSTANNAGTDITTGITSRYTMYRSAGTFLVCNETVYPSVQEVV